MCCWHPDPHISCLLLHFSAHQLLVGSSGVHTNARLYQPIVWYITLTTASLHPAYMLCFRGGEGSHVSNEVVQLVRWFLAFQKFSLVTAQQAATITSPGEFRGIYRVTSLNFMLVLLSQMWMITALSFTGLKHSSWAQRHKQIKGWNQLCRMQIWHMMGVVYSGSTAAFNCEILLCSRGVRAFTTYSVTL